MGQFISHLFSRIDLRRNKMQIVLTLGVVVFISFAINDIISVDAHAEEPAENQSHDVSNNISDSIDLPAVPLMSFSEEGLTGLEQLREETVVVKKGQTLSGIFTDLGMSQALLLRIANLNDDTKQLTKVYPGAELKFKFAYDDEFKQLTYVSSDFKELVVNNDMGQLSSEIINHPTQVQLVTTQGSITGSLFGAGKVAGLSDAMVMQLANIFSWDIDFVLEIRTGDSFKLIYEKIYKDGEYLKDGKILAATFVNQGKSFEAVYYENKDKDGDVQGNYYAPDGRSMKKAFLRAPLNFSYISSNFNPKRMHPILNRVKAHKGIDYRAPKGTPVYAAGAGRVIQSSYNKYNGHYVFIQHPNGIVTKYLHFTKRKVKKGQKVKQGQTIGTVGSTGLATAAHLHYEFIYNGVHRNPRTVSLPKSKPLPKQYLVQFQSYAKPLLLQLEDIKTDMIAKN